MLSRRRKAVNLCVAPSSRFHPQHLAIHASWCRSPNRTTVACFTGTTGCLFFSGGMPIPVFAREAVGLKSSSFNHVCIHVPLSTVLASPFAPFLFFFSFRRDGNEFVCLSGGYVENEKKPANGGTSRQRGRTYYRDNCQTLLVTCSPKRLESGEWAISPSHNPNPISNT